MMISTTLQNKSNKNSAWIIRTVSVLFWIGVWQVSAMVLNSPLILPTPVNVIKRLFVLVLSDEFRISVGHTMARIISGFLLALVSGTVFAVISGSVKAVKVLLAPFMSVMKSVPVASFVILSLFWLDTKTLSSFIAFVMVMPIIYINVLSGIEACDAKMLEMARVFKVTSRKKWLYVYIPYIIPFFRSGCAVALGLCWKAGVAAELIGVPDGTIGEQLYFSKIYYDIADLFAWTIVIILISVLCEKLFMFALNKAVSLYERS